MPVLSLSRFCFLPAALVLGAGAFSARAETVTLTPVADTSIIQKAPDNNMGAAQAFAVGNVASLAPARGLVKFDVAGALPAGSRVASASLHLTVVRVSALATPATFNLHRVFVGWGEGEKNVGFVEGVGAAASAGEASWNVRFAPDAAWSEPGGEAGADFESLPTAATDLESAGTLFFDTSPALVAGVQRMLDDPGFNFGWLIKDQDEFADITARRFGSREHPTEPPRLVIEFDGPLLIKLATVAAGQICLTFTAKAGKTYALERRNQVDSGEWTVVATRPPSDTTGEAMLCDPLAAEGNRFYRVEER